MFLFASLQPESYPFKFILLLVGAALIALGVALQVIANVIMGLPPLAPEASASAISPRPHIKIGYIE